MRAMKRPILILLMLLVSACSPQGPAPQPRVLTVLAAASLTETFGEIGARFEAANPGVEVEFSFAGSQALAGQLGQGVEADVFASASPKYMEAVAQSGRVNPGDAAIFAKNRLVVIVPAGNPAGVNGIGDLARPGLKLDLADRSVPAGQYVLDFLDRAAGDAAYGPAFKEDVLRNVVSYEENVKSVLTKVLLNEADAGIVYATDITPEAAARIEKVEIPEALNILAAYPVAPVADSRNPDLAKAFVAFVLSPEGQAVLAKYGFLPAR